MNTPINLLFLTAVALMLSSCTSVVAIAGTAAGYWLGQHYTF